MSDISETLDSVLESDFFTEMVRQMRAIDSYGTYDEYTKEKIIEPFILTKEMKREIPIVGDPDEILISRIKAYYNAISALIEKDCKLMAVPMLNLTHEGFGRVIISVGKLIVVDRTLRDVHRFGFPSHEKMQDDGEKILAKALQLLKEHRNVAEL